MTFLVLDVKSDPNDAFEGNIKKAKNKKQKNNYIPAVSSCRGVWEAVRHKWKACNDLVRRNIIDPVEQPK